MDGLFLAATILIQLIAVLMVLYTFRRISEKRFPQLNSMEKYHLMRKRYEHLRWSLLFVGALIIVQLAGVFYYFYRGSIPLLQLLVSNIVVIAIIIFLTRIYKDREHLQDMGLGESASPVTAQAQADQVVHKPKKAKKK